MQLSIKARRCKMRRRDQFEVGSAWSRVLAVLVVAVGCSDRSMDDPEPPAHRVEACEGWCQVILNPVCGPEAMMGSFDNAEECVELCAEDYAGHWAPQDDGEDACADEQIAYYTCVENLECSVRAGHWDEISSDTPLADISCGVEIETMLECDDEH